MEPPPPDDALLEDDDDVPPREEREPYNGCMLCITQSRYLLTLNKTNNSSIVSKRSVERLYLPKPHLLSSFREETSAPISNHQSGILAPDESR